MSRDRQLTSLDNAYGLIVQISAYEHVPALPPVDDAAEIAAVLTDPEHGGYPPANVRLLLDTAATRASLLAALDDLAKASSDDSTVFVYFSGHGGRVEAGPHAGQYLLPVDAVYPPDESLAATAISGEQFTAALGAIPPARSWWSSTAATPGVSAARGTSVRHPSRPVCRRATTTRSPPGAGG